MSATPGMFSMRWLDDPALTEDEKNDMSWLTDVMLEAVEAATNSTSDRDVPIRESVIKACFSAVSTINTRLEKWLTDGMRDLSEREKKRREIIETARHIDRLINDQE